MPGKQPHQSHHLSALCAFYPHHTPHTLRPSPVPTSQLPDIRCLCLASNDINDITFEALALALTYKDAPAGLEEMDLTQNQLSVGGVQRLLPLLNKVRVGLGVERALDN